MGTIAYDGTETSAASISNQTWTRYHTGIRI